MRTPAPLQNRDREGAAPSTYLITFACYGTWLPGQAGAVDRRNNLFGSALPEPNPAREARAKRHMLQPPYFLDEIRREVVLNSIRQVCSHRDWLLYAAHARTNHVHVVVEAEQIPEQVMNTLKSYASRALSNASLDRPNSQRWARHGSTRHLWTSQSISAAIHYVVSEQGEPMAVFERPLRNGRGSVDAATHH